MTVVIAGCGDVGTEAGLRYVATGRPVLGLRRSPQLLPSSFETQAIDLAGKVPTLPADTDIVVLVTSAAGRSDAAYKSAYVETAASMLSAIRRDCHRAPRVLFVSSTAVYGVGDGSRVDEQTPIDPTTPTSARLLEAEQLLQSALDDVIVLRLGGIYGPGRGRLIEQAQSGHAIVGPGHHFTNRIHRDDAAAAIVHLTTSAAPGPLYLGVDHDPAERGDVLRFLAAELGTSPLLAAPFTETGVPGAATGKRCDSTLLRESGFVFTYPTYREGYRAVLGGHGVRHP